MFNYISKRKQQVITAKDLAKTKSELAEATANLDYLAMMTDIELESSNETSEITKPSNSHFKKLGGKN
jgi:hypothetical protein